MYNIYIRFASTLPENYFVPPHLYDICNILLSSGEFLPFSQLISLILKLVCFFFLMSPFHVQVLVSKWNSIYLSFSLSILLFFEYVDGLHSFPLFLSCICLDFPFVISYSFLFIIHLPIHSCCHESQYDFIIRKSFNTCFSAFWKIRSNCVNE